MNPDCKWKQEEFGYIYLLTRSLASDAFTDKNPKKGRGRQARVGIWNHCALGFQLPTNNSVCLQISNPN
jgi:hypothetical protein